MFSTRPKSAQTDFGIKSNEGFIELLWESHYCAITLTPNSISMHQELALCKVRASPTMVSVK